MEKKRQTAFPPQSQDGGFHAVLSMIKTVRRNYFTALFLLVAAGYAPAQESILVSYERNFVRANLTIKAGILRDAATDERAAEFIGQLYDFALTFSLRNAELLHDDPDMITLTALAAGGAGRAGYRASADTLWKLFPLYRDSFTRCEILGAIGTLGKDNIQIVESINQFLANQNSSFRSGIPLDYPVLQTAITALGNLGNKTSYPVLFAALMLAYPDTVPPLIPPALDKIQGNYKQFILGVLQSNPGSEKLAAFRLGVHNGKFSAADQGELAQTALEIALAGENDAALALLRYEAVQALTALKWNRATDMVIRHFYRVQTDYGNGAAMKDRFLEAISCLGVMESSEAAQVLALQLGLLNSQTEQDGVFDEDIILALVSALGEIGDKVAFDYLLYIGYLDYPTPVQSAAKNALSRLKW
jgi:hypothetical protein